MPGIIGRVLAMSEPRYCECCECVCVLVAQIENACCGCHLAHPELEPDEDAFTAALLDELER